MFDTNFPRVAVHDLFLQERDNDLLIGTHGRSIYKLELEPLQALESLAQQEVSVLQPEAIKHNKNWGKKYRVWSEAIRPGFSWIFYAAKPTAGTWQLTSEEGVVIFEEDIELSAGLQPISYDLIFMEEQIKKYNRKHKDKLMAADDGKTYLTKGNYKLMWNDKQISTLIIQ